MSNIFTQLAVILTLSSVLGFVIFRLKLPLLIAYLASGLLLAAFLSLDVSKSYALSFLPEIGIAFVLFLVGMELDLRELKSFGKQIIICGVLQIIISGTLGTFIAQSFGFDLKEAMILGVGLAFSSTIVAIKLLLEKKELTALQGKLSVGILLLEDLLAVLILLILTSSHSLLNLGFSNAFPFFALLLKIVILFFFAILLAKFILPKIFEAVSDSGELLFLTALAWCFGFVTLSILLGFSTLIGAFLAGVALASSPYHFQIEGKIKPMRDFFVSLFFVYLGSKVHFEDIFSVSALIISFTAYAVLIKPVIFLLLLGMFGFRKHTMFKTAINMSQISEFSMIILLIGLDLGISSQKALTVIATSTVLSFIISSLLISRSDKIYKLVATFTSFFERKNKNLWELETIGELSDHVVVVGAHRIGGEIVKFLKKEKMPLVVLDFNPHQVELLLSLQIPVIFGDMADPDILDLLKLDKAKLIISTNRDINDNKLLIEEVRTRHSRAPIIVRCETVPEAKILYKAGADYVLVPDIMAGDSLLQIIKDHLNDKSYFKDRPRVELEKLSRKTLAWE